MLHTNGDHFTSFLPVFMSFIYFYWLTVLAGTSNIMLNKNGESGCIYRVPDIREKVFIFSPLIMVLVVGLLGFLCDSLVKNLSDSGGGEGFNLPREMWVQSLGHEDPLEEEMATHSSIVAWWIPLTEEPGGHRAQGCKETRLSTHAHMFTCHRWPLLFWGIFFVCPLCWEFYHK